MADASYLQTSFLGGEWSPRMQGRLDLPKYRFAMTLCLNGIPVEEGAWVRRSGTAWLGTTRSGNAGRVIGWEFQEGLPMFLEFTDGHMRAFQSYQFGNQTPVLSLLQTDARLLASISTATPAWSPSRGTFPGRLVTKSCSATSHRLGASRPCRTGFSR